MAAPENPRPGLDPLGLWRDMLTQWERGLNNVANQAMGSDEFSRAMHQITSMQLRMHQAMGEALDRSLQALKLPTRSDVTAIGERLARIEARLDALAASQAPAEPPPSAVPRTRKPPARD